MHLVRCLLALAGLVGLMAYMRGLALVILWGHQASVGRTVTNPFFFCFPVLRSQELVGLGWIWRGEHRARGSRGLVPCSHAGERPTLGEVPGEGRIQAPDTGVWVGSPRALKPCSGRRGQADGWPLHLSEGGPVGMNLAECAPDWVHRLWPP